MNFCKFLYIFVIFVNILTLKMVTAAAPASNYVTSDILDYSGHKFAAVYDLTFNYLEVYSLYTDPNTHALSEKIQAKIGDLLDLDSVSLDQNITIEIVPFVQSISAPSFKALFIVFKYYNKIGKLICRLFNFGFSESGLPKIRPFELLLNGKVMPKDKCFNFVSYILDNKIESVTSWMKGMMIVLNFTDGSKSLLSYLGTSPISNFPGSFLIDKTQQ